MTTDWIEGKGIRENYPDPNWADFIKIWPSPTGWTVKIIWGTTWGHLAYGKNIDLNEAIKEATEQALADGCPTNWLEMK